MEYFSWLNDGQMWDTEQQVFVQLEQVPFYCPEKHEYGDQQNGGQYGGQLHQGPTAINEDWYGAPIIEEHKSYTTLLNVEYWSSPNPGPSTIAPITNVAPEWIDLQTFPPPANVVPAMTYDAIPVYTTGGNTAPTFEEENGNNFVPPVKTAPPMKAPVSQKVKKPKEKKVAEGPYIKKPLNAFMLFLKENRKSAEKELGMRTSAEVNKFLSQSWKSLSAKKKEKFTGKAKEHSLLHSIANPGWTSKINYRNKRKRSRTKA
ncbi:transcription factor 7-like 2 [Gouania willdenowi]|uniref:transcription factor 7-like 2 n=1 Tax=Gouania willdenowi TaxID=441366 RepID=UPI0010547790|nr:transcription factor 7-like 2 [Gouania willdenowi]